jgi:hypothetical protein
VDDGEEVVGQKGFEAEVDGEVFVLLFGLGHAADDQHGHRGREGAQARNELGAVHAGHDVVGDDEVDGSGELFCLEGLERAFRVEHGDDVIAGAPEDGLPGGCLDGVVVDQ